MSAFEDAVRKRLKLEGPYVITVDSSGGGQYQLGDYTWGSDPYEHTVSATPITVETHVRRRYGTGSSFSQWERGEKPDPAKYESFEMNHHDPSRPSYSKDFETIPDIWAWLEEEDRDA